MPPRTEAACAFRYCLGKASFVSKQDFPFDASRGAEPPGDGRVRKSYYMAWHSCGEVALACLAAWLHPDKKRLIVASNLADLAVAAVVAVASSDKTLWSAD